jgi:hypothetical protein
MKHIRTYENYRIKKNREEIIKESVLQVNDIYKVKTMIDIPQSLINAYVKKVKDTTGKNLRQFFGDVDIAEEIVKYINMNNLDVEKLPGNALMGGQVQGQSQGQSQQSQAQTQSQSQVQVQTQGQDQGQSQEEDFEEPQGQGQSQEEGQAQGQGQGQAQGQGQGQAQGQGQGQGQEEEEGQAQEEEEGQEEEELPED